MTRVVSLFLPRWPTDRLGRHSRGQRQPAPEAPLVLAAREGASRVVSSLDAAAEAAGLRKGMALARARALVPGLGVREADPRADRQGLERLALWALARISPLAAADPPDGLVIDTTGADHLHGGEAAMLDRLVARLGAHGIEARAAIADTWGAAHACARFLPGPAARVVAPGQGRAVLHDLPIAALRLDQAIVDALRTLGLRRIGDLMARPRAPLALRFGPDPALRLDQALGMAAEPIEPARAPDLPEAARAFAEPISAPETIARHTGELAAQLCARLEAAGLGARRLDLILHRVDATQQAVRIGLARPARDAAHLARLLRERIETIDPGFGIEAMRLCAPLAEPLGSRQLASPLAGEPRAELAELLDTLANRVGGHRLYRFAAMESDVPERSLARMPPLARSAEGRPRQVQWERVWSRPARLLPRPEPIETMALLPDHAPVWFVWRGARHAVRRADGPERIFGEWWKRDAEIDAVRDYFRVEDEGGGRYWIFRAGDGENPATGPQRWFLHGLFA